MKLEMLDRDIMRNNSIFEKPELSRLRLLYFINMFLLVTTFVMPQYFGVHIGYDITCTRLANILLVIYGLIQIVIFNFFLQTVIKCDVTIPLMLYLLVALYTMVFRTDINAFMLVFFEILSFYMMLFAIRYVIGCKTAIKTINVCAYILCFLGFVEFITKHNIFLMFFKTVPTAVAPVYRSGYIRIMGPCGHPLGYGLLLILFIVAASIDLDRDELFLYQRPVLLVAIVANVFLTGSRSSQGIVIVEMIIIIILSNKTNRRKSVLYTAGIIVGVIIFTALTYNTKIGKYIMMQVTTLIDEAFDTTLSAKYGVDIITLKNSSDYREFLPKIFTLDWLNPLLGRGVKRGFGAEFMAADGTMVYIHSIDNYYVQQYIKYAYPGMIAYIIFLLVLLVSMIRQIIRYKSGVLKALCIGIVCYFFNLWYLDALQTLKFVYVMIAVFYAFVDVYKIERASASAMKEE